MTKTLARLRLDPLLVQAAIAGALSFSHLHDIAQAAGQSGWQAWAYPVSVDLLLVAAWRRLVAARDIGAGQFMPWLWFLVALAASLGANVATAGLLDLENPPAWLRLTVAGWPALAFLGGTLLVHRPAAVRQPAPTPEPAPAVEVLPDLDVEPEPVALPAPPKPPAVVAPALLDHARRIADTHRRTTGHPMTPDALRARLGVPAPLAAQIAAHLELT
ncbi:DUF2637 domain-containing protein [Yinghuangia soli]|uniref:DUF2637 domain-containing protein n=1 Tax=Yinghuangia soli TaxID=2908204 RepID=A0AA41U217_9ACTN|nr:DUF2637 domain-containing protein [Yinghuangia soli]MCF2531328.1 DUF2637 domain-containing protein [Yinghuangia soli]